jgi:hypothetical protein
MATYPTSPRADFLTWCQAHTSVFVDNAVNIGLTEIQAAAFQTAVEQAADAANAQQIAKNAAKSTTLTANDEFAALRKLAASAVRDIKTFADDTGNNNVYVLAQIPAPAAPSPLPPPAKPSDLTVELDPSSGSITLRWKANNPRGTSGTSYIIRRRLPADPQGEFAFIGVTGTKKYVDATFIAGPDAVQYTVQGQRADSAGPLSDIFTVSFGRAGQARVTSSNTAAAPRLAA